MKKKLTYILLLVIVIAGLLFWHQRQVSAPGAVNQTKKQQAQNGFNKSAQSLADPASIWVIVNKKRPLNPIDYTPANLTSVGNGQVMAKEAADAFTSLLSDGKAAGYSLLAESGYRSYNTQVSVYNNEVRTFGQAKADTESAKPGYSEHQTGWAVDIAAPGCNEDCFGTLKSSAWVSANAYKYGFVLRYPADKSDITGYRNEPWHLRYVGKELAEQIHSSGQTLEEFFSL